jgi:FkbM family methyltransferase
MSIPSSITRLFERLGMRGAPTLLRQLSKTTLSRKVATVTLPAGQTISFPAYDEYWARHFYAGVPFEPDVEQIFRRFAKGRVLIDCGANIGYWSVRAKELGFAGAIAIEANEALIPILRRNHQGSVIHAAVYSKSGETLFLKGEGVAAALGSDGKPVKTLALADLRADRPAIVKLDVEGAEIEAIKGAGNLDATFVYEDWPKSGMPVTDYLLRNGYALYGFDMTRIHAHDEAFTFNSRTRDTYGPSNFLATRSPI